MGMYENSITLTCEKSPAVWPPGLQKNSLKPIQEARLKSMTGVDFQAPVWVLLDFLRIPSG